MAIEHEERDENCEFDTYPDDPRDDGQDDVPEYPTEPDESMDGDFDSGMASAGMGTDEDYGYFGGGEE